jgi:hypothetical protein
MVRAMRRAVWRLVLTAALIALLPTSRSHAGQAGRCPTRTDVARLLKLEGSGWQTACKAEETGPMLLAALSPPGGTVQVVLALGTARDVVKRLTWKPDPGDDKRLREALTSGEEWTLRLTRTRLARQDFMRVSLGTKWGGNLLANYEIVGFFRESVDSLVLVWSGIGDWEENRFDICLLKAHASFKLTTALTDQGRGKLERTTRITRRKGTATIDEEPAKQVQKECAQVELVHRDVFSVAVPPL